jgi:tetratricopeptide (TPR) repeat protein
VFNWRSFFSVLIALSSGSFAQPALSQALVPHTIRLDPEKMERQGIGLAQEAAQLAQFQQYELALPRAQLATQLAPKSQEVWSLLGGLYLQTNDLDKGISALKRAQSLDGKNAAVLFALGSAYFQKGQYSTAVQYLNSGLKIRPNVPGALFDLGNAHLMLRQYPLAIAQYEKAATQDKTFWPAINNIGLIDYEQGRVDAAIQRWQASADIDNKAAEPRLAIAVALYSKGDREKGLTLGETAIKLDSRYADLKFLKENLWGERLLADTQKFLETPQMKATIAQAQERLSQPQSPQPRPPQPAPPLRPPQRPQAPSR